MAIDYAALKNELLTDPAGLGYAPLVNSGNDAGIAAALNATRQGIAVNVGVVPAYAVFEAIVPGEWAALSAQEKQRIQTILSMGQVDTTGGNTRAAFQAAFATGSATRSALNALLTRPGSRAESLFGGGARVSDGDVARALRAT
jgi:hypothetical protein